MGLSELGKGTRSRGNSGAKARQWKCVWLLFRTAGVAVELGFRVYREQKRGGEAAKCSSVLLAEGCPCGLQISALACSIVSDPYFVSNRTLSSNKSFCVSAVLLKHV